MTGLLLAFALATGAGESAERLARIDGAVEAAISAEELPGAVVLVERRGRVLLRRAYGHRALLPEKEPMTPDTIFDVASLTKPVATATSVMILVEEGKLRLLDPVAKHIPEFAAAGGGREKIIVEQLLLHRAGFPPDDPIELYMGTPQEIFERKYRQPLESPPGQRFRYSDVGYEVLAELVRRVSGKPLNVFAEERIFRPLGMRDTRFLPRSSQRIAPTERHEGAMLRGIVHDPRARALGGVAGHAGLFSTADDLARYCRMILGGGSLGRTRILSPLGVAALTRPRDSGDGYLRALGWDVDSPFSKNRGDLFPIGSFGHTGFTGTSLWLDPGTSSFLVFLSSQLHPDGKGNVTALRGTVATLAAAAILDARRPTTPAPLREVLPGLDALEQDGFRPIAGKRVGLVTNPTGRTRDGRPTIDVLASEAAKKAGVTLVKLFSPEHGIRGEKDEAVADEVDTRTGLPVVSLYGERQRPRPQDFAGLDAIVVDLQDVGVRFYTYLTTLGIVMEEAAQARVSVVVLDRPNPINGAAIEGPLPDPDKLSFTAYHSIPIRTGMTIGELARLFNAERRIGADLTVVKMRGWSRRMWYDETGLEWVNPSPNMRSLEAATLYPGIALFETTNISVGRGTDTPFQVLGAPWLDGAKLGRVLSARRIPGVHFTPIHFTPRSSESAGELCGGIRISVVDRDVLRPVALGLEIATALRALYPTDWDRSRLDRLLANRSVVDRIERGDPAELVEKSWENDLVAFQKRRATHLLYP